jgi:ribonuclease BN (tRNA processing enzyme)
MRVRFVGSGDAFGSGGRWQTCIHLSGDGQVLLVDCGATSLTALRAQGLDPGAIGAVAVTHHLDYQTLHAHLPEIRAQRVSLTHMSAAMLARLADSELPAAYDGMVVEL